MPRLLANHQPPAGPPVVAAGGVTAATVDVASISPVEKHALLAKIGGFMSQGGN